MLADNEPIETERARGGATQQRGRIAGIRNQLQEWGRASLELLLPRTCIGCSAPIENEGSFKIAICADCREKLPLFEGSNCVRCASIVPSALAARENCAVCRDSKLWFDEAIALSNYDGLLRDWVLRMKRSSGDGLSLALGEMLWSRCQDRLVAARPDVVVPVPSHWRRRLAHATNSAAVIAEVLARRLHVPLATRLLRRTRNTPPQFSLPASERLANVRGALAVRLGYHLREARVLLVDDILTTGSTCTVAARELRQHGAIQVSVAVVARTISH